MSYTPEAAKQDARKETLKVLQDFAKFLESVRQDNSRDYGLRQKASYVGEAIELYLKEGVKEGA